MDIGNLAPGVRTMLKALGFQPDDVISLLKNVGDGIQGVRAELVKINSRLDRLEQQKESDNGRSDEQQPGDGTAELDFGAGGARGAGASVESAGSGSKSETLYAFRE